MCRAEAKLLRALMGLLMAACASVSYADCVILLHGLARSENSMVKLESRLTDEGFTVVNAGYPSRENVIEVLAEQAIRPALAQCPAEQSVSFVTHSLGGILVRQFLAKNELERIKRVVMLGPPNGGSEVVDKLGEFPGFRFINGKAGLQLGTGEASVPNQLGEANFDLAIIAGNRSINLILSALIPGPDDGKVSVERTKLEGARQHITLPVTHPFMMKNDAVIAEVVSYLKTGQFSADAGTSIEH